MSSARRRRRCVIWTGCLHASNPAAREPVIDQDEEAKAKEAWWATESERLFAQHTARWTERQRHAHRFMLDDPMFIPGLDYQTRLKLEDSPKPV